MAIDANICFDEARKERTPTENSFRRYVYGTLVSLSFSVGSAVVAAEHPVAWSFSAVAAFTVAYCVKKANETYTRLGAIDKTLDAFYKG